jgi:hypothetical protein
VVVKEAVDELALHELALALEHRVARPRSMWSGRGAPSRSGRSQS